MANKRKTTTAIVAGVTAVALLLGGTFAWTSISQRALNETAGIVNVGGRLHDDFNGTNKDIYVENFTDPLNGGQPIYARVKLTEYMEVGQEAGKLNDAGTAFDADRNAKSVIDGATIDNVDSWSVHKPVDNCAECQENGELCVFHKHWKWEMGGKTTYLPTFNKDKDSLKADINGTYAGTNKTDKVYYDDYVVYTTDGTAEGVGKDIAEANKEAFNGSIYSVIGTEYYDDDTDTEDNGGTRQVGNVTHTAKETVSGTVITMAEWETAGSKAGNFWVYDTDGWAYWANPIMPGEATGLLLSNIDMFKNPGEKCYYSINVVGQFATVNDWEYFTDGGKPSDDALKLLSTAANNVTVVTVKNDSNTTTVEAGATVNFSATASVGGTKNETATFDWAVYDADLKPVTTSTIENGVLNVGATETNANLIIAATDTASGAVGLSSIAVTLPSTKTITDENIKIAEDLTVNGFLGTVANVTVMDDSGAAISPQPDFAINVMLGDTTLENSKYAVTTHKSTTDPSKTVTSVLIADIGKEYVVRASYTGDDGNVYTNTASVKSESKMEGTLTDEMTYEKSVEIPQEGSYTDIGYYDPQKAPGQTEPNIKADIKGLPLNGCSVFQVELAGGSDSDVNSLNYHTTLTVVKNGEAVPISDYLVITQEAQGDPFWKGYYLIIIPCKEADVGSYGVYATFVGDGQVYNDGNTTLEQGVTYGAYFSAKTE